MASSRRFTLRRESRERARRHGHRCLCARAGYRTLSLCKPRRRHDCRANDRIRLGEAGRSRSGARGADRLARPSGFTPGRGTVARSRDRWCGRRTSARRRRAHGGRAHSRRATCAAADARVSDPSPASIGIRASTSSPAAVPFCGPAKAIAQHLDVRLGTAAEFSSPARRRRPRRGPSADVRTTATHPRPVRPPEHKDGQSRAGRRRARRSNVVDNRRQVEDRRSWSLTWHRSMRSQVRASFF